MGINFKEICEIVAPLVSKIPKNWDGKNAILEMKEEGARWKDLEWMGFYFESLCKKFLAELLEIPYSKKYGNTSFDGFFRVPWDFKVHAYESGKEVIINDSQAVSSAIKEHGCVGLIVAIANVQYDNTNRDFYNWHQKLKGKISDYVKKRIARGAKSRKRKISLKIIKILFVRIDDDLLIKCGTFQEDFRNSNGNPRRAKVLLDLKKINENIEYVLDFT